MAGPITRYQNQEVCMGTRKFRGFGLVAIGAVAGILLSVGVTALAQRGSPLPLDELRQLSNVFAAIKNNYVRSEEHTSELQSLMRISYAVFCLKKKTYTKTPSKLHLNTSKR